MKIAYISSSTIPSRTANSIHVMKMCQAFRQLGHDIHLLAPKRKIECPMNPEALWSHYGIQNPFRINWIGIIPYLREHDYAWRAAWWAKKESCDLVYTRNIPSALAAGFMHLPCICEIHSLPLRKRTFCRMVRRQRYQKLVVISQALKSDLLEQYGDWIREDHILICSDAVDLERFSNMPDMATARRELGWDESGCVFGYAGQFYKGKGIETIFKLARKFPEHRFMIMGGNEDMLEYWRHYALQGNMRNIHSVGFIANQDLPQYLAACDALLMPYQKVSVTDGGLNISPWLSPMKMFEYMASGRLIITSDLPVLREVLSDDTAVFCAPDRLESWVHAIQRVSQKDSIFTTVMERAKRTVQNYSWKSRIQRILASCEN